MKTIVLLASLLPLQLLGQCIMTTTAHTQGGCLGSNTVVMSFSVFMNGGTPPYTVHYGPFLQSTGTTSSSSFGTLISLQQQCGVMWPHSTPYPYEVEDAVGCVSSGLASQGVPAAVFELSGLTWETVVETDNTVTVRFGNPPQGVCPTYMPTLGSPWFDQLFYSLSRNGVPYQTGVMSSVFSASKLVFGHLPAGNYLWQFTAGSASNNAPWWCSPDQHPYSMQVPSGTDVGVNVDIATALAGAFQGALMSDALRTTGAFPLVEPYSSLGYTYVGTATGLGMDPALLAVTGASAIVDWIAVELRSVTAPHPVIASRPALLTRDGEVMDLDGDPYVGFPGVAAGNYRVALRHRNHLGVMTGSAFALGFVPVRVNFRSMATTFGTNAQTLISSTRCLWPGDVTFDGTVKYAGGANDRDPILTLIGGTTPTNSVNNVYISADVNLDGIVKYAGSANDRDVILQTVGGTVPTATRTQQLP
ncbi:MAG: hypothetical protein KA352_03070 [Flavobacteriales bacterium]|nr:hypothetical protein [Flavobacteriales bacterium]